MIKARFIVNASGLSSDRIEAMVGIKERRMWLGKGIMIVFDPLLGEKYKHIMAPLPLRIDPRTKGGAIIIDPHGYPIWGPNLTVAEDKEDETVSEEDIETIVRKFRSLLENFSEDRITYYYAGVRPVNEDTWDFVLGPTRVKGFINAAYILSPGLTASPIIAEKIVEFLRQEGLELKPKSSFVETRKSIKILRHNLDDYESLVRENQSYSKILCPDKLVSEAEVIEAINRGARTVESVLIRLGLGRDPNVDPDLIIRIIEILRERGVQEVLLNRNGTKIFTR